MPENEGHGWRFMDASGVVHGGPLHLIRVLYNCEDDKDELLGYDGTNAEGRPCLHAQGNNEYAEQYELGIRLTTGLYISLEEGCFCLVVFDPLEIA